MTDFLYILFALIGLAVLAILALAAYRFYLRRRNEDAALLSTGNNYGTAISPNDRTLDSNVESAAYQI